ncbi:MAG: acyl-CoA thioesterase, partial [Syntrophothermus sp.]
TNIRVRGYELDSYGHVNNAVYLQYLEQGRWEFMKDQGLLEQINLDELLLVIIETNIKYIREARLFDDLFVETGCDLHPPFLIFHQRIVHEKSGLPVSRAKIKALFLDKARNPLDIPAFVTAKLKKENG